MAHYLASNGGRIDDLPDNLNVYRTFEEGLDSMKSLFLDMVTDEEYAKLESDGIIFFSFERWNEVGAGYIQIERCTCPFPTLHDPECDTEEEYDVETIERDDYDASEDDNDSWSNEVYFDGYMAEG